MTRILVTGRNGQVGAELVNALAPHGEVTALDRHALDLTNVSALRATVRSVAPQIIVNAAAYTAVDRAESERALAFAVNATAPGILAEEAQRCGAWLIHYSTDYVFDGSKAGPYVEEDATSPLNVYGESKLAGEHAVQAGCGKHVILRTSWVYGARGKNFFLTIRKLVQERDDLTEAIRKLRLAIQSLNREGRERLLAAFEVVNGHFKELFTSLFGGGAAELQLVESDDPLEAGLEILARPPGKKPSTMTLLSGGEQALTAMSLIFAVFLTNPSPICVLDEVDAPLDDSNVERFCDLLEEMRKKTDTRFVTITHNPITMARMDRLFGVTMAERGVSQLVSVELREAESFLEAV